MTDDGSAAGGGADGQAGEQTWTPVEQALLEAALEFYSAAGGVIEFTGDGSSQLHLRHHADGFKAIRQAMGTLQERVVAAHAAGASPERIAQIARMEQETIDVILQRQSAAPSSGES
ncbi:MAG TPA: hypothetical protein VFS37_04495 [Conexibacter sp.]|nr:hypothetical protein [Conexibacter sp.]